MTKSRAMATSTTTSKRGGKRENAGRKHSDDPMLTISGRVRGEQKLKFEALGGFAWLRDLLDATPFPGADDAPARKG